MSGSRDKDEADAAAIAIEVEDDDERSAGKGDADGGKGKSGEEKSTSDGKGKDDEDKPDLSEEEQRLKDALDLAVVRAKDADEGVAALALETMRKEIRSGASASTEERRMN